MSDILKMPKDDNSASIPCLGFNQQLTSLSTTGAVVNTGVIDADKPCVVRVCTLADIYIDVSVGAVATAAHAILPSGTVEYFTVLEGHTLSALKVASGGALTITKMG